MAITVNFEELRGGEKSLLLKASEALKFAYNPYSNFSVGAALLTLDGTIITGSNVENAAYGSTICAERAAILRANAVGIRNIMSIAVIGRGKDFDCPNIVAPCGSCRQMLFEAAQVSDVDIAVIMSNTKMNRVVIAPISELLPFGFGPKNLGIDVSSYR